ncbi:MAG: hypothetical protein LBT26_07900 [Clostridiales Family XIII bacterium]|jgi:hypothetical protein|nr:hypothetical protein [Clostridiales Family XIII bacterium]
MAEESKSTSARAPGYLKEGESLNKRYKDGIRIGDVLDAAIDICGTLEALEEKAKIYGDINLANILRGQDGAYGLKENHRGVSDIAADYMPPEYHRDNTDTGGVDLYALGIALYRLLNYNRNPFMPPWPGKTDIVKDRDEAFKKRMEQVVIPMPKLAEAAPADLLEFAKIVLKACAFRKRDRWQGAAEMKEALLTFRENNISNAALLAWDCNPECKAQDRDVAQEQAQETEAQTAQEPETGTQDDAAEAEELRHREERSDVRHCEERSDARHCEERSDEATHDDAPDAEGFGNSISDELAFEEFEKTPDPWQMKQKPARNKYDGRAIASMVLGIAGNAIAAIGAGTWIDSSAAMLIPAVWVILGIIALILGILVRRKQPSKMAVAGITLGSIPIAIMLCAIIVSTLSVAKMPESSANFEGKNYQVVTAELQDAGFTNIKRQYLEDLITAELEKDGEVEQVSVNGIAEFSAGSKFDKDAEIVIIYHTFPKMPESSTELKGKDYQEVTAELQEAGFTNIEMDVLDDLIIGWLKADGEVEQVSVDGETGFSAGSKFAKDAKIVITYHAFPERVTAGNGGSSGGSNSSPAGNSAAAKPPSIVFVNLFDDLGIYVRSTPSANSGDGNKILYIKAGDRSVRLEYLGTTRYSEGYNWYNVRLPDGRNGWVRDDVVMVYK